MEHRLLFKSLFQFISLLLGPIWDPVTDAFRRKRCGGGELKFEEDDGGFDSKTRR